jgi:hypothetical protein
MPAQAGIHLGERKMDSRFRGNDALAKFKVIKT